MASNSSNAATVKKLVDNLQTDLRSLSSDCKRKYPPVKEAAEASLLKLRNCYTGKTEDPLKVMLANSVELVQPFIMGCDTKNPKIVHHCLGGIQKMISCQVINAAASKNIVNALWVSMEAGVEELKLLQTVILLVTTNSMVLHEPLAKAIVLCFRLHFTKDSTTINTAAATVRQLVSVVFERVIAENASPGALGQLPDDSPDNLDKTVKSTAPTSLRPCAQDAYMLFQDFCQLVNADQPMWLMGMTEMTRTFGLELMENVLSTFPDIFTKHPEFSFLLKERVCPLVIKLFSPSLKYRTAPSPSSASSASASPVDKPYFPIVMRLLRIVAVLIQNYYKLLITECEIFLSLLVKFLDSEKPMWQRATALEVLNKLCAKHQLIRNFCESYDMKAHSTKIFEEIVNGLSSFIQSQFVNAQTQAAQTGTKQPDTTGQPPSLVGGMPVGSGVTPQPAFYYRNIWTPLVVNISAPQGSHRPVFIEMLDKIDPPFIPDGYGLSLAFLCMLDIVRCVQTILEGTKQQETEREIKEALIDSSWCGTLAAFTMLLDASTDESATEAILKAMNTSAYLCGLLELHTPRDAFITALCKASLPPHYTLTILSPQQGTAANTRVPQRTSSTSSEGQATDGMIHGSQVVAVGTALATSSLPLGAQQGPVMLTAKNIQCMRSILTMTHCHGTILGTAWHQILTTLQHLVWILGLKPSAGGSLKGPGQASDTANAVITTAVMADLPVLSAMLSRLFESSQYLDDVALHHLIDALCKLSSEAMELALTNKEPSLFAVAKLLETGLVNLPRVEVLWRPVTRHLLEVCQHPHAGLRSWGAEAVTALVKAALQHKYQPPLRENVRLQALLLAPLEELSSIHHSDIRQKQLDCTLHILHDSGEALNKGWPLVLGVIGAVNNNQGDSLIRTAFQCLQLVVTDFLPIMPCTCLQVSVEVASKFGLQNQDMNISLTAIGLLWNISDYFYQQRDTICRELSEAASQENFASQGMPLFDALWMCLFTKLGELCVDPRPAVRKSAGQTLFSTIAAHGGLLQSATWQTVLWKVLFPLLDKVKKMSSSAADDKDKPAPKGNILIHHSRDTAEKQWAETRVLTLAGVARVFNTKRKILQHIGDFPRAWALLLEFIELSALCPNSEVSLAALKSFQEILQLTTGSSINISAPDLLLIPPNQAPGEERMLRSEDPDPVLSSSLDLIGKDSGVDDKALWANAWRVWLSIGTAVTTPPSATAEASGQLYVPSQPFLTALIQIFPALYNQMRSRFVAADLQKLSVVLQRALAVPVHSDSSPFIMPVGEIALTPLHEAILGAVQMMQKEVLAGSDNMPQMTPDLFDQMLKFVEFAVKPPKFGVVEARSVTVAKVSQVDWVAMNYVPFAEGVIRLVVELYATMATQQNVIEQQVLHNIIKAFHLPLSLKYGCPAQSTWMLTVHSLLNVLAVGLPIAAKHESHFRSMWIELGHTLEDFLFSQHPAPPTLSVEDFQRDEAIDCKVVSLLRDDILPHSASIPQDFVMKVMHILNKGSIHSAASSAFIDVDSSRKLREEFAKACFETLLQFSFINPGTESDGGGAITKLAVSSLLKRCKDVLEKYVEDERLSGKCPLPRPRMSEMAFVLKAISTLLQTLKKAPPNNVEPGIWTQVVGLYPALVECTTSTSSQVCRALKEALAQYTDLLAPPQQASASK